MRSVLDHTTAGPGTARVVDRIRAKDLLQRLGAGFVPARTHGVRATVEWRIETAAGIEGFQMQIDDGSWRLAQGRREPSVMLAVRLADLADLVAGQVEGADLFLNQRLTVSGDFLLAVRVPYFFGLTFR